MRAALMIFCLMLVSAGSAEAKIYRWVGPDGKAHYSDQPVNGARNLQEVEPRSGTVTQRQAPAETDEKQAARAAECASKRAQLNTFKNATKLVEKDSLGRDHEFTAEEKKLLISKTEAEVEKLCNGAAEDTGEGATAETGTDGGDASSGE